MSPEKTAICKGKRDTRAQKWRRGSAAGPSWYAFEMHVRVDAARHDDASRGVDHALGGLRRKRAGSGNRRNLLARDADVAFGHALGRHHVAALDDQFEHRPVHAIWTNCATNLDV